MTIWRKHNKILHFEIPNLIKRSFVLPDYNTTNTILGSEEEEPSPLWFGFTSYWPKTRPELIYMKDSLTLKGRKR